MSDLSDTELRRLDLTLLLVFLGLIRHRKSAAVALELGLTQSAISQALKRLREIFGDELFLRRPHGMEPTAMALALEGPVASAVEALRGAVGVMRSFDPKTASGLVHVAALHTEQAVLLPPFAARLRDAAPGLQLSIIPRGRADAVEALNDGKVDLALGFFVYVPETISAKTLYEDSYLVAGRPESLPESPKIGLDQYCAAEHILTSLTGSMRGVVDDRLETTGRHRRVVLSLPAFLPALGAAATTGALVTLPARVASAYAHSFGLVTATPPVEVRTFPVSVLWHRRNNTDPRTQWIVSQLQSLETSQV